MAMFAGDMQFARQRFAMGAVRAEITHQGKALAIFSVAVRNRLARAAFIQAGNSWITNFLPKRFTPYVMGGPFGYGKRKPAWLATKLRTTAKKSEGSELAKRWTSIKNRDFDGWDPWSSAPPPASLMQKWVDRNPEKYKRRRGVIGFVLQLNQSRKVVYDVRKWAKDRTKEYAASMQADGIILPLVRSGDLRDKFASKAHSSAIATRKRCRLTITIPRGDRQSQTVGRVLGTLPYWEGDFIAKNFIANFREAIKSGTIRHVDAKVASLTGAIAARKDRMETRRMASSFRRTQTAQAGRVMFGHD